MSDPLPICHPSFGTLPLWLVFLGKEPTTFLCSSKAGVAFLCCKPSLDEKSGYTLNCALNADKANMGASVNGIHSFPQSCFYSTLIWVCIIPFYLTPVPRRVLLPWSKRVHCRCSTGSEPFLFCLGMCSCYSTLHCKEAFAYRFVIKRRALQPHFKEIQTIEF